MREEQWGLLVDVLDALLDGHSLYRAVCDADDRAVALLGIYMNPVGLAHRGLTRQQFLGADLVERTLWQGNPDAAAAYLRVVNDRIPMRRRLVQDHLTGHLRAFEINAVCLPQTDGPALMSMAFRDVTEEAAARGRLERQARQLADLASTDPLTGLANRRTWDSAMARLVAEALTEQAAPLAVAVADLDSFKAFNDTRGHPAGDDLLMLLARTWRGMLHRGDVLARVGGEEFALALPGRDLKAARQILERLSTVVPEGQTVSVGVTLVEPGDDVRRVFARADNALYAAKRAGRARVMSLPPG